MEIVLTVGIQLFKCVYLLRCDKVRTSDKAKLPLLNRLSPFNILSWICYIIK
jgi:hypothetical protein